MMYIIQDVYSKSDYGIPGLWTRVEDSMESLRVLLVVFVTQDQRPLPFPPSSCPPSLPSPWHVECCLRARSHALAHPLASRQGQGARRQRWRRLVAVAAARWRRHGRRGPGLLARRQRSARSRWPGGWGGLWGELHGGVIGGVGWKQNKGIYKWKEKKKNRELGILWGNKKNKIK